MAGTKPEPHSLSKQNRAREDWAVLECDGGSRCCRHSWPLPASPVSPFRRCLRTDDPAVAGSVQRANVGVLSGAADHQESRQGELGDQSHAWQLRLVIEAGAVAQVQGAHRLATPTDGHVQDGIAAERLDQFMIEEIGRDVFAGAADVGLAAVDDTLHPG